MGQKYAAYDANGKIVGFYDSVDSPLPKGVDAIPISDDQWQACLAKSGGFVVVDKQLQANLESVKAPAPPTPSQLAQGLLKGGVDVISNSTPAVSSTYKIDPMSMAKIMTTALYVQMNKKFPGTGSYAVANIKNAPIAFESTELFLAFANALTDYVAALDAVVLGTSNILPKVPVTF